MRSHLLINVAGDSQEDNAQVIQLPFVNTFPFNEIWVLDNRTYTVSRSALLKPTMLSFVNRLDVAQSSLTRCLHIFTKLCLFRQTYLAVVLY